MLKTLHLTLLAAVITAAIAMCPSSDWKQFRDMCYWGRSDYGLRWEEVADECNTIYPGAGMVTIHDLEQNMFIADEIAGRDGLQMYVWIGLSRASSTSSRTWIDGSPYNFTMWFEYDPDYHKGDCTVINFGFWGTWAGWDCNDPYVYFMCQIAAM